MLRFIWLSSPRRKTTRKYSYRCESLYIESHKNNSGLFKRIKVLLAVCTIPSNYKLIIVQKSTINSDSWRYPFKSRSNWIAKYANDNTGLPPLSNRHCLPTRSIKIVTLIGQLQIRMCKYIDTHIPTCICIHKRHGNAARVARERNVPISNFTSKQSAENVFGIDGWNVTIKVGDRSLTAFSHPPALAQPELTPFTFVPDACSQFILRPRRAYN